MKYLVIKPFRDISGFKMPGDHIELSDDRAAKLRAIGLIGGTYKAPGKAIPAKSDDEAVANLEELIGIYPESKELPKKLEAVKKKAQTKKVK